jgi:NADH-quinone oxidoreductase subunit F
MGTPLRYVIENLAGGLKPGSKLQAVLIGGAAGVFLTPDEIDVPLAFESLNAIGATFGSGAIIVIDDVAKMWGVLLRLARFFRDESCGKCFPCQIGTQRQLEILEQITHGRSRKLEQEDIPPNLLQLLRDTGAVMRDTSLCGLGQTASSAILSAFDKKLVQ